MAEINRDVIEANSDWGSFETYNPLKDWNSFLAANPVENSDEVFSETLCQELKLAFSQRGILGDAVQRTVDKMIRQQYEKVEAECAEILSRGENPSDYYIAVLPTGEMQVRKMADIEDFN